MGQSFSVGILSASGRSWTIPGLNFSSSPDIKTGFNTKYMEGIRSIYSNDTHSNSGVDNTDVFYTVTNSKATVTTRPPDNDFPFDRRPPYWNTRAEAGKAWNDAGVAASNAGAEFADGLYTTTVYATDASGNIGQNSASVLIANWKRTVQTGARRYTSAEAVQVSGGTQYRGVQSLKLYAIPAGAADAVPANGTALAAASLKATATTSAAGVIPATSLGALTKGRYWIVADYNGDGEYTAELDAFAPIEVVDPPPGPGASLSADHDTVTAARGVTTTIAAAGMLGNDTYPAGPAPGIVVTTPPHSGSLVALADGSVAYTPAAGFSGMDEFTYVLVVSGDVSNEAVVSIDVPNEAPSACDDSATTDEDALVRIDVLGNDTDPESDPLFIVAYTEPAHGTVAIELDGGLVYLRYTPDEDWSGVDTFEYTVDDGHGGYDTATVTVAVNAVSDAPTAADDDADTFLGTPVTVSVLSNDQDADGDALTVTAVAQGAHGSVAFTASSVTYTPVAGFVGTDSFTYTVADGFGGTASAAVSVTVALDLQSGDDSYEVHQGKTIDILAPGLLANDPRPPGRTLTVTGYTQPVSVATGADVAGDTLTVLTGGRMQYRPAAGFVGIVRFTYTVSDGYGYTATHAVYIDVTNVAPTGVSNTYSVARGGVLQVTSASAGLLGNDSDADQDKLYAVLLSGPPQGTLYLNGNGTFSYRPANGQAAGPVTFTYRAFDGAWYSDPISVTIDVV